MVLTEKQKQQLCYNCGRQVGLGTDDVLGPPALWGMVFTRKDEPDKVWCSRSCRDGRIRAARYWEFHGFRIEPSTEPDTPGLARRKYANSTEALEARREADRLRKARL
jgi:hypothetical protein